MRGMDDCSLSKVKRPRGAATIVGELKRKFANLKKKNNDVLLYFGTVFWTHILDYFLFFYNF